MLKTLSLILPLLILVSTSCIAQVQPDNYFWNTDFEYATNRNQPRKWSIEGEGQSYKSTIDKTFFKSGKRSLKREILNAEMYIILPITGKLVGNKKVEVSVYHKTDLGDTVNTAILLLRPGAAPPLMSEPRPIFSTEWEKESFSYKLPHDDSGENLLLAFMAAGSGTIWTDAIEIKIDGKSYGDGTPDFREPTSSEIELLNKTAIDLSSVKSEETIQALRPLKNTIGQSTIVALGENSHGSAPIYQMKLHLLQFLVKELDFTVFALESPTVEADKINAFVLGADMSQKEVVANLAYKSWQTEEMLAIVNWMRKYNQTSDTIVYFQGFDMQNEVLAMKELLDYSLNHDTALAELLKSLDKKMSNGIRTGTDWQDAITFLNKAKQHISTNSKIELSKTLQHYLTILSQSIELKNPNGSTKSRDEYMAENIEWIQKNIGNGKVIISADNDHIRKGRGKAGYYLSENFRSDYYTIGFTFESGTYAAYGPEKSYIVHPSYAGTYEYLFKQSDYGNYFIDLSKTVNIPYLNATAGFRSIGSRPQENTQFFELDLTKNYDAIIFIEKSTHTQYVE